MSSGDQYSGEQYPWTPRRAYRPVPPPQPGPSPLGMAISMLLLFALIAGGTYAWRIWRSNPDNRELYGKVREPAPHEGLFLDEKHNIEIYNTTKASVVHVTSLRAAQVDFFNVQQVPEGTGSGFVWDDGGHIVTNYHVIKDADGAKVTIFDQKTPETFTASLVGAYPDKDVAVLRIDAPEGSDCIRSRSAPPTTCRSARTSTPSATRSASTRP